MINCYIWISNDDVIKWKHFLRYWPFVQGIHRGPVNSPHKGQWRGALMFSSICVWIISWVNNRESGDLRRYRAHYDFIVMQPCRQHLSTFGYHFVLSNKINMPITKIPTDCSYLSNTDCVIAVIYYIAQYDTSKDTRITPESAWWLQITWCLFGTGTSATNMMTCTDWYI